VKKILCFSNLALMLGCLSSGVAYGQYPGAYGSLAPSSYPTQQQYGMQPQYSSPQQQYVPHVSGSFGAIPAPPPAAFNAQQPATTGWVGPQNGQYHLAATQVQNPEVVPMPVPQALSNAPQQFPSTYPQQYPQQHQQNVYSPPSPSIIEQNGQPTHSQGTAQGGCQTCGPTPIYQSAPGYAQSIAPGCTTCGTAPFSHSFSGPLAGSAWGGGHFGDRLHGGTGGAFGGLPAGAKPYFGGAGVLLFHRVDDTNRALAYDVTMPSDNLMGTRDARMGLMPGFEVFLGRYFNCGRNAISVGYWGLYPETQSAVVSSSGGADLRSRIPFGGLDMPAFGTYSQESVYDWFDAAMDQQVVRSSRYHNVEANLLGFATGGAARSFYLPTSGTMFSGTRGAHRGTGGCGYCGGAGCNACGGGYSDCGTCESPSKYATGPCSLTPGCGSRCNVTWLGGVRYFRFTDDLRFGASRADMTFGSGNDDIYYDANVTNDLVGFQLGSMMNYCVGKRLSFYGTTKMGIYNNHSRLDTRIAANGNYAYLNGNPSETYMVSSSKNDVAFLGELGTGLNVRLTPKWSGTIGYRGIAASGVATAPSQIPYAFNHLGNVADFNNNSTLILHGLNIGGLYNF
jgi:hypothetical protein